MDQRSFNMFLSAVKRCFSRTQRYKEALKAAEHPTERGPKGGKRWICAECGDNFGSNDRQVDHIDPVVPINKATLDMTWCEIFNRLYCSLDNLQVLCIKCHKQKSKVEMGLRAKERKKK